MFPGSYVRLLVVICVLSSAQIIPDCPEGTIDVTGGLAKQSTCGSVNKCPGRWTDSQCCCACVSPHFVKQRAGRAGCDPSILPTTPLIATNATPQKLVSSTTKPSYTSGTVPLEDGEISFCANEGDACNCHGTVYYGQKYFSGTPESGGIATLREMVESRFVKKRAGGSVLCSSSELGEPNLGYYKHCYCIASPQKHLRRLKGAEDNQDAVLIPVVIATAVGGSFVFLGVALVCYYIVFRKNSSTGNWAIRVSHRVSVVNRIRRSLSKRSPEGKGAASGKKEAWGQQASPRGNSHSRDAGHEVPAAPVPRTILSPTSPPPSAMPTMLDVPQTSMAHPAVTSSPRVSPAADAKTKPATTSGPGLALSNMPGAAPQMAIATGAQAAGTGNVKLSRAAQQKLPSPRAGQQKLPSPRAGQQKLPSPRLGQQKVSSQQRSSPSAGHRLAGQRNPQQAPAVPPGLGSNKKPVITRAQTLGNLKASQPAKTSPCPPQISPQQLDKHHGGHSIW